MMRKMLAGAALVATLVGSVTPALANEAGATSSQTQSVTVTEADLPSTSMTPDNFFYFLKIWVEKVQVALTRDAAARATLLEQQAETRLAEAVQMAEAGKTDLAQKAMNEAQAKLLEAARAIERATETGKDLSKLTSEIEEDQARYAKAISKLLEELPEAVREELEPLTADLLVQVAAAQDAANEDETAAEEAEKAAEEAGLEEELAALQPRMILVLKAMSEASGKELGEVYGMYKQNPGLGRIAKELGLKMGPVQHAAQIEWKKVKAGSGLETDEPEPGTVDEERAESQEPAQTESAVDPAETEKSPSVKEKAEKEKAEKEKAEKEKAEKEKAEKEKAEKDRPETKGPEKAPKSQGSGKALGHDKR